MKDMKDMKVMKVMQHNYGREDLSQASQFVAALQKWVIALSTLVLASVQVSADIIQNGDVSIGIDSILVASDADGSLEVNGGDELESGKLAVANSVTVTGNVLATDSGTIIRLTGPENRVSIERGTGSITIDNGAVIDGTAPGCPPETCNFFIANGAGSDGNLIISGVGSTLSTVNFTGIGIAGVFTQANDGFDFGVPGGSTTAFVQILNGGLLESKGGTISGGPGGGSPTGTESTDATVIVDGLGSAWHVDEFLSIASGPNAFGRLDVRNGGHLSVQESLSVGSSTDGIGQLSITKATVHVGNSFIVAFQENSSGTVRVSGGQIEPLPSKGTWFIGLFGEAMLTISKAGTVVQDSDQVTLVAFGENSTANIRVSGQGSVLDAGAVLALGVDPDSHADGGSCNVTIGKGGLIRADEILLGPNCNINGKGTLQGSVIDLGGSIGSKLILVP
jgi:T5SS/PEP-CTERM-associated repeat protein